MTLYEELGVARDATAEQIKEAYRRKAMKAHPDREGGNEEAFKRLQEVYDVLSDPRRRKRYDATGQATDELSIHEMAVHEMQNMLIQIVEHEGLDVVRTNLVELMVQNVKEFVTQTTNQKNKVERAIRKKETAIKRMKRKGGGDNFLVHAVQQSILTQRQVLAGLDQQVAVAIEARKIMGEFEYQVDIGDISFQRSNEIPWHGFFKL